MRGLLRSCVTASTDRYGHRVAVYATVLATLSILIAGGAFLRVWLAERVRVAIFTREVRKTTSGKGTTTTYKIFVVSLSSRDVVINDAGMHLNLVKGLNYYSAQTLEILGEQVLGAKGVSIEGPAVPTTLPGYGHASWRITQTISGPVEQRPGYLRTLPGLLGYVDLLKPRRFRSGLKFHVEKEPRARGMVVPTEWSWGARD